MLLALQMSMGARLGTNEVMAIVELDNCVLRTMGIWKSPSICRREISLWFLAPTHAKLIGRHLLDSIFWWYIREEPVHWCLKKKIMLVSLFKIFVSTYLGHVCRWFMHWLDFCSIGLLNLYYLSSYPYWFWYLWRGRGIKDLGSNLVKG